MPATAWPIPWPRSAAAARSSTTAPRDGNQVTTLTAHRATCGGAAWTGIRPAGQDDVGDAHRRRPRCGHRRLYLGAGMAPWKTDILYYLGKERLGAADPSGAVDDLRAFLHARAPLTRSRPRPAPCSARHGKTQESRLSLRSCEPANEVYPDPKPPGYIAGKNRASRTPCLSSTSCR